MVVFQFKLAVGGGLGVGGRWMLGDSSSLTLWQPLTFSLTQSCSPFPRRCRQGLSTVAGSCKMADCGSSHEDTAQREAGGGGGAGGAGRGSGEGVLVCV